MATSTDTQLSDRHLRFVKEYLVDLNATAAAERAGYNPSYARRLCTHPRVQAAIQEAVDARAERTNVDADRVFLELARVGLADIRDLMTWDESGVAFRPSAELTVDQSAAIQSVKSRRRRRTLEDGTVEETVELEMKLHSKLDALKEMGRHLGIADKIELRLGLIERIQKLDHEILADLDGRSDDEIIAYLSGPTT